MKVERNDKSKLLRAFLKKGGWTLLSFLFLILFWCAVSVIVGNAYLLPSLTDTLGECGKILFKKAFWVAYASTLFRSIIGFTVSIIISGGVALLSSLFVGLEKFFSPIFSLIRSLPTMAILLVIILWTSANVAPIVVSSLVLIPMLYSAILSAKTSVDTELIEMSKVYGVPKERIIKKLFLPSIFSSLSRESLSALGLSLKLIVSAEIMANTFQSIGGQMQTASLYAQIPTVFALAMIIFITSFMLECIGTYLIKYVERRFL